MDADLRAKGSREKEGELDEIFYWVRGGLAYSSLVREWLRIADEEEELSVE